MTPMTSEYVAPSWAVIYIQISYMQNEKHFNITYEFHTKKQANGIDKTKYFRTTFSCSFSLWISLIDLRNYFVIYYLVAWDTL